MAYNYRKFETGRGWRFEHTRETYGVTAGGNFSKKPARIEKTIVTGDFYVNFVQSIPWFNHSHLGETCRATWGYTPAGYIPVRIVSSKKGYMKYIDTFRPID